MKPAHKRIVMPLFVALALATFAAVPELLAERRPDCQIADEWMLEHPNEVPRTYDALLSFPLGVRHRFMDRLSPDERTEIWRVHLSVAGSATHWNDAQRAVITEVASS